MEDKKILNASEMGKIGGSTTKARYGLSYYQTIGKKGGRPKKNEKIKSDMA